MLKLENMFNLHIPKVCMKQSDWPLSMSVLKNGKVNGKVCAIENSESQILKNILTTLRKNTAQINQLSNEFRHIKEAKHTDSRSNKAQTRDKVLFICLFGVLRRFQHCTGHITTGSWKGRGNQYI